MRLAICDDCKEDRRRVQDILKNCLPGVQTEVVEYENGHTLLEHADRYDVIILDIEMPDMDGIEVKERLQWNSKSIIIFVTSHEQRVKETHGLNVYGFVEKSALEKQLSYMIKKLEQAWSPHIMLASDIDCRNVEYLSAENIYTMCYMINGESRLIRASLGELGDKLKECGFFMIHRSCLVNMRYIKKVKQDAVEMESCELSVSVRRRKHFQEVYEQFCRKNARFSG